MQQNHLANEVYNKWFAPEYISLAADHFETLESNLGIFAALCLWPI